MSAFADYLAELHGNLARDDATEHTHRLALQKLLQSFGQDITVTNEPARILCGAPDLNITHGRVPLGHIETKDVGTSLDAIEKDGAKAAPATHDGRQFKRFLSGLPNWILTNYLEFRWFVNGERRLIARLAELDSSSKIRALPGGEAQLSQLLTAFLSQQALTVGTARDLARRMAGITHIIRDLIIGAFEHEQQQGWLHNWLAAFREVLIPDLDVPQFADMFAQTIAYGLFAACVNTPAREQFSRQSAAYAIPKTNPFLRKLFSEIAGVDMPDTIAWAVDDLVNLLRQADMAAILRDFGKGKGKEDPVVHFYETFLAAYDPKMREVRGVYYTPEPVVSYIVRSVDYLLKTRFNRPKGLADENTLILDPATGTGTFLYFVINQIHDTIVRRQKQQGAWDGYVRDHLLNRVFGFELLIAPYAIAHLKLGMQLAELGYKFGSDQRLGIYLTNTLEEAAKKTEQLFAGWIAEEANAAARIKRDDPILVVLGNPPYSGHSANRGAWITGLLHGNDPEGKSLANYFVCDGKPLGERNPKWLQDDYVKFIRFAQWRIEKTGEGIVAFITNHGYLDNPTFRGMRQSLMHSFNEIYVYDLHGNAKKKERAPDGGKDENVFDIQQGVAICLCVKQRNNPKPAKVFHADLWGLREIYDGGKLVGGKYHALWNNNVATTKWTALKPFSPNYLFVPQPTRLRAEYAKAWKLTDVMPVKSLGIATARDSFCIQWTPGEMWKVVEDFVALDPEIARAKYKLGPDARDWKVTLAQQDLKKSGPSRSNVKPLLYRPFDIRFTYWTGHSRGFHCMPRHDVMRHMLAGQNLALSTTRSVEIERGWEHCLCTNLITQLHTVSLKEVNYLFPLYLYEVAKSETRKGVGGGSSTMLMALFEPSQGYEARRANLNPKFIEDITQRLGLKWVPVGRGDLKKTLGPEDVFNYAYAVFHSPTYRQRYVEFLKVDFPRLPLTSDVKLFRALAAKGAELVELHLMESERLNNLITTFPVKGTNEVEKVQFVTAEGGRARSPSAPQAAQRDKDGRLGEPSLPTTGRVWINPNQYFGCVPKAVWEFHIGGYQVCEKWLKDRKGRKLSYDEIQHYQKIVVALNETIRVMAEIDRLIPHWPLT